MREGRRTAAIVAGVVVALAAAAIAANGSAPGGSGGGHRPSEWSIDVMVSLLLVWLVVGAIFSCAVLILRPSVLSETAAPSRKTGRVLAAGAVVVLVILVAYTARRLFSGDTPERRDGLTPGGGAGGTLGDAARYEPSFATVPVILVFALAAVAAVAWLLAARARRTSLPLDESVEGALAAVLDDTLDDLRAERDPRRAVIAAYARLERVLGAHGAPRRPAEAPDEYLRRVLESLDISRAAVTRLTALFQAAKFSQHEVDAEMKNEAIEALVSARDELREARDRAAAQQAAALAHGRAQVGT